MKDEWTWAYLVGHTSNTDTLLMVTDKGGSRVEKIESIAELNVLIDENVGIKYCLV